jgi:hypothetical protein
LFTFGSGIRYKLFKTVNIVMRALLELIPAVLEIQFKRIKHWHILDSVYPWPVGCE